MRLLCIFLFLMSMSLQAAVELSAEFGYEKDVYGDNDQNKSVTRSYSGSFAWYLFTQTAIEINYSHDEDIDTQHFDTPVEYIENVDITGMQSRIETQSWGFGLRQVIWPRATSFRPMISFGYAKQKIISQNSYTFDVFGEKIIRDGKEEQTIYNSAFLAFILQYQLSKYFAISGSARTSVPDMHFSQWERSMKYTAGLTLKF